MNFLSYFVVVIFGINSVNSESPGGYGSPRGYESPGGYGPPPPPLKYDSSKFSPRRTVCVSYAGPGVVPEERKPLDYYKEIPDLVDLTRRTLTKMAEVASDENPRLGANIALALQTEITKATQIWADFANAGSGGRFKRQAADGGKALNDVGKVLAGSNDKIKSDKGKLSPDGQKRINKKHKDAVDKCMADSCKSASKILANTDGAERQ